MKLTLIPLVWTVLFAAPAVVAFLVGPPLIGLVANQVGLGTALWVLPVLALGIVLLAPVVSPPKTPMPSAGA